MELSQDPLKGAMTVVVHGAKDAVVPIAEVGVYLIEKMKFILKEANEMLKHEKGWKLLGWVETAPVEEGLKSAIRFGVAEVWAKVLGLARDDSKYAVIPLR